MADLFDRLTKKNMNSKEKKKGLLGLLKTAASAAKITKNGIPRIEYWLLCGQYGLINAVKKPEEESIEEWLSLNVLNFFNQINLLYGSVSQFCTAESCPTMNTGPKWEFLWADGREVKKPIRCTAQMYVTYLMAWVQKLLEDETVFPVDEASEFPKDFVKTVKTIMKKLNRVYAHMHHNHIQEIIDLGIEAHLNNNFKHFYLFVMEFKLVDEKELEPMKGRIIAIEKQLAGEYRDEDPTGQLVMSNTKDF